MNWCYISSDSKVGASSEPQNARPRVKLGVARPIVYLSH